MNHHTMEIRQSKVNNATILELKGHLNSQSAPNLEKLVVQLIDQGVRHLVFGCEELQYCSSAGLRVFLIAAKRLKSLEGRCVFASLGAVVHEAFEITGFLQVLDVREGIPEAVN
jgi:anti-anti-sigma factor